ncbi:MAG: restriction endonuclease [Cobetia sp.]|uniref:restriction endonuclease n=1 Tax=Cobetia sp. TaxID=1873876 RepID=UPI00324260C3|tara:strand:- start:48 stop:818 length:771 start_codon:yes stop_codon:yes gene_type:complete
MIDREEFTDWHDLQNSVCRLLQDVGLIANTEVNIGTPRGSVEVDVYAIDMDSLDNISYVVECKNWNTKIPQAIVHAFTTVMHETGANIGCLITKRGLQSGAERYIKNTNIHGLTYEEFQKKYFSAWWDRYFCPTVGDAAYRVHLYTEPQNTRCWHAYEILSLEEKIKFQKLRGKYSAIISFLMVFSMKRDFFTNDYPSFLEVPKSLSEQKEKMNLIVSPYVDINCSNFRDLHAKLLEFITDAENEFNEIFGGYMCD